MTNKDSKNKTLQNKQTLNKQTLNKQTFDNLNLPNRLVKACKYLNFETPTEIQKLAIPQLINGKDVTGIAQTGTGKTAAFSLPILASYLEFQKNSDNETQNDVFALILCPTRELAIQSANAIGTYAAAAKMHDLEVIAVYGGSSIVTQLKALKNGAQIVVATPGRLIDLIERKKCNISNVKFCVLDEADEMLKMGFTEDVEKILSMSKANNRQTALFSATMPSSIQKISEKHQNNPINIKAQAVSSTSQNIEQSYAVVPFPKKTEATRRLIMASNAKAVVVFVKTRATVSTVCDDLNGVGIKSVAISGDVAQKDREKIVEGMRKGKIKVLIATDVAARGLDIAAIELVINYDLPTENEAYVHRIGRTGRAGRLGKAVTFINPREGKKLESIEKLIGQKLTMENIPSLQDIAKKQAKSYIHLAKERASLPGLDIYQKSVINLMNDIESEQELIRLVSSLIALGVHDTGEDFESDKITFFDKIEETKNKKNRKRRKQNAGNPKNKDSYRKPDKQRSDKKHPPKRGRFKSKKH